MTSEPQTVAEFVAGSLAAARVLEKHGIDYCTTSEDRLEDVCARSDLDYAALLQDVAAESAAASDDRDWTTAPLDELIRYLSWTDHPYFRSELQVLEARLRLVVATYGTTHPSLLHLPDVFSNLTQDLETHMQHEESDVFPAIERYLHAAEAGEALGGSPLAAFGGPLRLMELEHESAGAAFRLIREFLQDYRVPENACLRYRMLLLGFQELEDRLLRHIYLENNVLFPRAVKLKVARAVTRK